MILRKKVIFELKFFIYILEEAEKNKKKKKKEPPFNVPEWAKEITAIVEKVKNSFFNIFYF